VVGEALPLRYDPIRYGRARGIEKQAEQLGAGAVIGVDIDYGSVGSNMLMISASGTAVKLA
jgi:uncharacterized protein YbjQ (UPF0145 family)